MKILVTGGNGLVGSHFVKNYGADLKGDNLILSPSKKELDITDRKSTENFFKLHTVDVIIHFAAYTDVSGAEKQRGNKNGSCWIVNVLGTNNLVKAAHYQPYFIHISTDNVFSGQNNNQEPYDEYHPTEENPNLLSWYGWTKREAEILVNKKAVILRISNPVRANYPPKLDYVRKILSLYDEGKLYPMFDDQFLTLTYINDVTEALKVLLKKKLSGIYHVSSVNIFTPYKLANSLIERFRGRKGFVKPISIRKFLESNPARYSQYGGLKVEKTQQILNLKFLSWEQIIESLAKQLSA